MYKQKLAIIMDMHKFILFIDTFSKPTFSAARQKYYSVSLLME
jgi:hypothetical protein